MSQLTIGDRAIEATWWEPLEEAAAEARRIDPSDPDFVICIDRLACTVCQGKELPGLCGVNALSEARLLISGVIAAYVVFHHEARLDLEVIRELIKGPHLFEFCRTAMSQGYYVRSRLAAFAMDDGPTNQNLLRIKATAALVLGAYLLKRK